MVTTSKSSTFTKYQVKYLEYLCIKNAIEINRFDTDNQTFTVKPYVKESMEADAAEVRGRRANGWMEWKDAAGVNIDKLFRDESGNS